MVFQVHVFPEIMLWLVGSACKKITTEYYTLDVDLVNDLLEDTVVVFDVELHLIDQVDQLPEDFFLVNQLMVPLQGMNSADLLLQDLG